MKSVLVKINGWFSKSTVGRFFGGVLILAFWILLWHAAATALGKPLLLPTPLTVFRRLFGLAGTGAFWQYTGLSLLRVSGGILAGIIIAVLTAALTAVFPLAEAILRPVITVVKSTPVSSFIILAMLWISRDLLPVFIAFLMVFPVVWSNVHTAWRSIPREYLDLCRVYGLPRLRRVTRLAIPWALPYFLSACESSFGFAWKAGIAAEVLSLPVLSIGKQLFESKLYLETTDLFAWTVVVIILSVSIEKLAHVVLRRFFPGKRRDAGKE